MKLKSFSVRSPLLNLAQLWGSGHTRETDPFLKGWRAKLIKGTDNVLVGRRDVPGCFSVRALGDGDLDVALYYGETATQVARAFKAGQVLDAEYITLKDSTGWGLSVLRRLAAT